jgi:hypothetical protein
MNELQRTHSLANDVEVIEFSLMPVHKNGLRMALESGVNRGVEVPDAALLAAARDHLPAEMLREMRDAPKAGGAVLFVMHNAPEIGKAQLLEHYNEMARLGTKKDCPTFADLIARGTQLTLGHKSTGNDRLQLRKSAKGKYAMDLHKDGYAVSAFSTVVNDQQAPTRFTNWKAALAEASTDPALSRITIRYGSKEDIPLGEFSARHPEWEEKLAGTIRLGRKNPPEAAALFDALIERHSRDIILQPGDMALWANKGMLVHSGRDGTLDSPEGTISRATVLNLGAPLRSI